MNLLERVNKVAYMVEQAGGRVYSRKKMHKLVYLLQQSGEDFDQTYQYLHYGVFSVTLASDIDIAGVFGLISEKEDERGFTLTLDREAWKNSHQSVAFSNQKTRSLLPTLNNEKPRVLEALSTIVYLNKDGYEGHELRRKLVELKPSLKGYFARAYKLARKHFRVDV